jgi:hypothetical protein
MRKVLKWVAIGFVGLIVLGVILGPEEEKKDDDGDKAAQVAATPEEAVAEEATPEPEPTPTPKPELQVEVTGPSSTTQDAVTLRGTVSDPKAKVHVKGASDVRVEGKRWAADVNIRGMGTNMYRVVATRRGSTTGRTAAEVVRERSAAELAVIRQEKAAARAGRRALASAESYLEFSGFSKQGLYEQLSSDYGEGFTAAEAQYAVDHVDADWNKEAVESARSYLETSPMSRDGLIEQLSSPAGEGFTYEQAVYAVNTVY